MTRNLYPSPDLMTRRDNSLMLMYADKIHGEFAPRLRELFHLSQELISEKVVIQLGKTPANPDHAEWTIDDVEQAIRSCKAEEDRLEQDEEEKFDRVLYALAKREGFQAGIRATALAFRESATNPGLLADLLCALSDDDFSDHLLYQSTKDMPDPYTDGKSFFPLPEAAAASALMPEEGGQVEC